LRTVVTNKAAHFGFLHGEVVDRIIVLENHLFFEALDFQDILVGVEEQDFPGVAVLEAASEVDHKV
jgi:hypothetical protein